VETRSESRTSGVTFNKHIWETSKDEKGMNGRSKVGKEHEGFGVVREMKMVIDWKVLEKTFTGRGSKILEIRPKERNSDQNKGLPKT
jgi:hypothetical protein